MKKQDITFQDKVNELRLDITHPNSSNIVFVFVEGESDIRLFRKFFNTSSCKVENIPGGKFKLEEAVRLFITLNPLVLGIRDADFLHLNQSNYSEDNMFLTEYHDVEISMINEPIVFSTIIYEFTDIPGGEHLSVRDAIFSSISKIGTLRWLNDVQNLRLAFEGIGFRDLLDFDNQNINIDAYVQRVLSRSENAVVNDVQAISSMIAATSLQGIDLNQLCNGHDFVQALAQFLRVKGNGQMPSDAVLASIIRISFTIDHFKATQLYTDLQNWAELQVVELF